MWECRSGGQWGMWVGEGGGARRCGGGGGDVFVNIFIALLILQAQILHNKRFHPQEWPKTETSTYIITQILSFLWGKKAMVKDAHIFINWIQA